MRLNFDQIPKMLSDRRQWVLWKMAMRGNDLTKVPFQPNGDPAKSNDASTWCSFEEAKDAFVSGTWTGVGFEFSGDDGLCGIDLDGCRNEKTGQVSEWAREIILALDSYAEVSPSKTGVKIFVLGKNPFNSGKKKPVQAVKVNDKEPAIEIYDRGRYFAVTGWRLQGPTEPQHRGEQLQWLAEKYWPEQKEQPFIRDFYSSTSVVERARKYLAKISPAVSGQGGHNVTFHAACVLVMGFGLSDDESLSLLREWNQSCQPPWSERELIHKITSAQKQPGERCYLRNVQPERWQQVRVPEYKSPPSKPEPKLTTIVDAAEKFIEKLRSGPCETIKLGIPDLDSAIGGVERGELVVIAARPSHGKSAVALQCAHNWTANGMNCLIISEEMSALALGKRSLQFISETPSEYWHSSIDSLTQELSEYSTDRASCYIAEGCGTTEAAIEQIESAVENKHVECVVVDYAQLLRSPGKTRYEQVTNTSLALRQVTSKHNLVLIMLCQMSRQIEARPKFVPVMSDIKETGQLEQDADVILFLVWPHRIDSKQPAHEFIFYVAKNRNRAIAKSTVICRFDPSRQRVLQQMASDMPNYEDSFDSQNWN